LPDDIATTKGKNNFGEASPLLMTGNLVGAMKHTGYTEMKKEMKNHPKMSETGILMTDSDWLSRRLNRNVWHQNYHLFKKHTQNSLLYVKIILLPAPFWWLFASGFFAAAFFAAAMCIPPLGKGYKFSIYQYNILVSMSFYVI